MKSKRNFGLKMFLAGIGTAFTINVIPEYLSKSEQSKETQMIIQQDESELTLELRKKQEEKRLYNKIKKDLEGEVLEVLANNLERFPSETFDILKERWKKRTSENRNLRAGLEMAIKRAEDDIPSIKYKFLERNVPPKYVFLGITESEWIANAISSDGAIGVFQQMPSTAILYGATITEEYNESLNPLFAAEKTALILSDLYNNFKDWNLALAAYNSGGLPRRYLKEVKKSKENHPSFNGYLMFLGRTIKENSKNEILLSYIDQNLGFLKKNVGLFEILESNYPEIFNIEPRKDTRIIYEVENPFEYKVQRGDSLWRVAEAFTDEKYDSSNDGVINRTFLWMKNNLRINPNVHPGQKISLKGPNTLREVEYQTGINLRKENPHVINYHEELPNGAKIILD